MDTKTYHVTIEVTGTDLGNVAEIIRIFADKIEEEVREEDGDVGMAYGSFIVKVDPPDTQEEEASS